MRQTAIIWVGFVLLLVAAALLAGWPSRREQQRVSSGLRAAELGAKLAFDENLYKEKFGVYTRDFARLGSALGEELPCPLEQNNTVLACPAYRYTVQGDFLRVVSQADPAVYFTFGLASGEIDCSHAPAAAQQAELCSAWE